MSEPAERFGMSVMHGPGDEPWGYLVFDRDWNYKTLAVYPVGPLCPPWRAELKAKARLARLARGDLRSPSRPTLRREMVRLLKR